MTTYLQGPLTSHQLRNTLILRLCVGDIANCAERNITKRHKPTRIAVFKIGSPTLCLAEEAATRSRRAIERDGAAHLKPSKKIQVSKQQDREPE